MRPGARVAVFVALLVVVFATAAIAGGAIDPEGDEGGAGDSSHAEGHGTTTTAAGAGAMPAGVASSQDGYRLVVSGPTRFAAGRAAPLTFRILDAHGATVRDFETEQDRRMHVIVVRRDLRRYQHLHPTQGPDGAWTTSLALPEAGVYRAFADFKAAGAQHTLGIDLFVPGAFAPKDLPAPSSAATVDGYEVALHEHPDKAGFFVRRAGKLVTDLQAYLGVRGHLVALREGDLAYEHVHPDPGAPPEIAFHLAAAQPGTYRLFLQFRHRDRIHTAAFTRLVK